jgi:hypothetical protein
MSYASVGPRPELRDTIRSTGSHRVILDAIWSDVRDKPDLFPEVVYAENYDGTERHLPPADHARILRAWRKYDAGSFHTLPVRITVNPNFALEPMGEGQCQGCDGTGDGPDLGDGMDDPNPCAACHGRGVVYVTRDVIGETA